MNYVEVPTPLHGSPIVSCILVPVYPPSTRFFGVCRYLRLEYNPFRFGFLLLSTGHGLGFEWVLFSRTTACGLKEYQKMTVERGVFRRAHVFGYHCSPMVLTLPDCPCRDLSASASVVRAGCFERDPLGVGLVLVYPCCRWR